MMIGIAIQIFIVAIFLIFGFANISTKLKDMEETLNALESWAKRQEK